MRINKTESLLFKETNKIHKPLARLTKGNSEKTQINKIRNELEDITTDRNKKYYKTL